MYTFEVFFYTISSVIQSNGSIDLRLFSVFRGFNVWAVLLILLQSFLGFGIGFILKFFDVILGLQASSIATALNIFISIKFFHLHASPLFFFGSLIVVAVSSETS